MTIAINNMENGISEQSDWLSVLIEQCPAEPTYVNAPDSWREFGVDGLDNVDANFEDAAFPAVGAELPSEDPACLEGLDLPRLDDLLWQDAVCNNFGVQPTSSASTHQSEPCQLANCGDCASTRSAQVFSNWAPPAPWIGSARQDKHVQPGALSAGQQQQQEVESAPAASSSPARQLPTPPPQARGVPSTRQEPSSSRDSCLNEVFSPASSCDLPESGHKRRRGEDSSPERASVGAEAAQTGSPADAAAVSQGGHASRAGSPGSAGDESVSEERKRQARMARNRESAQQSRARKKMQVDELERRNAELQAHNTQLSGMVAGLAAENAALRHQLALVQGHAQPVSNGAAAQQQLQQQVAPPPLPVPPPGMAVMPPPPGMPYMHWLPGMPYVGPTPKLPIQRLKREAPAAAPKKASAAPAKGKKARVAAGGTALLALFSFMVFMGPVPMWPGSGGGASLGSVPARLGVPHVPYAALPAPLHAGGRVLQSVGEDWASPANQSTGALLAARSGAAGLNGSGWGAGGGGGGNATEGWDDRGTALRPRGDARAKASALQRLKDLAPITLYSDWGDQGGVASAWAHTPGAGGARGGGQHPLLPPMQCREVFSLDAAPDIDAAAARRQLQAYLSGLSSFRGRALAGPLAMPPVSRSLPPANTEPVKGKGTYNAKIGEPVKGEGTYKAKIGAADEEEEVVVSIMLPAVAQQQGGGGGGQNRSFTSLDEVFVVVVKPLKRYVTYACSLSTPILV